MKEIDFNKGFIVSNVYFGKDNTEILCTTEYLQELKQEGTPDLLEYIEDLKKIINRFIG